MMKLKQNIFSIAAVGLLIASIFGLYLVGDRIVAAIYDIWKFGHESHGIDMGARSSFYFVEFCLLGISACTGLYFVALRNGYERTGMILAIAGATYLVDGVFLLLLVLSGAAFLYCGR